MELRHLRYFLAVADTLSFTRAAEQAHVSQPTLSQQVRQLEEEVGSTLLERAGRRVQLTPSGEIFRDYAQRALKEISSGTTAIAELEGLKHGALTIGVFESFTTSLLPPLLAQFSDEHPGVQVSVRQLPAGQLEEQLDGGKLHLALAYSPPATERIVAEKLFDEALVLVVGRKHRLARAARIELASLDHERLTLLPAEFPSRRLLENQLGAIGVKPRIVLEINSIQGTLATVRETRLATVLTERMAKTVPGLHCVKLSPSLKRTAAIFWRNGGYRTNAARAMAQLIKSHTAARYGT